jgi:hypothetical protein
MTAAEFDALLHTLPNGLHDADLRSIAVDFAAATVTCVVDVDLSDPDVPASEGRSRPARLVFHEVSHVTIDAPGLPSDRLQPVWIDAGSGQPTGATRPEVHAPDGGFLAWLYLASVEGFVRIGARSASLAWLGEMTDRP